MALLPFRRAFCQQNGTKSCRWSQLGPGEHVRLELRQWTPQFWA